MIPGPCDPLTSERAEERAPHRWGPLVSQLEEAGAPTLEGSAPGRTPWHRAWAWDGGA
jgi:hypothetical protein